MGKRQLYYESDKNITAQRLRDAMNDANISASELAERSKVSKSSISQYYNAKQCPSNLSATAMAKVLNVDPVWLMGFDVPRNDEERHIIEQAEQFSDEGLFDVYRKMGFEYHRILQVYKKLPEKGKEEMETYVDFLISKYGLKDAIFTDEEALSKYFMPNE